MRYKYVRSSLVKVTALRLASAALAEIELHPSDFDLEDCLTAEERLAIYKEIRSISNRLLIEAEDVE